MVKTQRFLARISRSGGGCDIYLYAEQRYREWYGTMKFSRFLVRLQLRLMVETVASRLNKRQNDLSEEAGDKSTGSCYRKKKS